MDTPDYKTYELRGSDAAYITRALKLLIAQGEVPADPELYARGVAPELTLARFHRQTVQHLAEDAAAAREAVGDGS